MLCLKKVFTSWYVRLLFILTTIIIGLTAYTVYYNQIHAEFPNWTPVLSTIRLFGLSLDVKESPVEVKQPGTEEKIKVSVSPWIYTALSIARYMALVITGSTVFNLLKPLLAHTREDLSYFLWKHRGSTRVLLVGNNTENISLYDTAGKNLSPMILCEKNTDCGELNENAIRHCRAANINERLKNLIQTIGTNSNDRKTVIIINLHDEEKNITFSKTCIDAVNERIRLAEKASDSPDQRKEKIVGILDNIRVIVLGDDQYQEIYQELEDRSSGTLRYTNRYQMAAMDFVYRYPLTKYLSQCRPKIPDSAHPACIRQDADINCVFIGFGELNQEIFCKSIATNQFIQCEDGAIPQIKTVNYHIFDKNNSQVDKNLNHNIFRYQNNFNETFGINDTKSNYLELPPDPAKIRFHVQNIYSPEFYHELYRICKSNPRSLNTIIIAFGDDLTNLDMAKRLSDKKHEWKLPNLHIFVRIQNPQNDENARIFADADFITFGFEFPKPGSGTENGDSCLFSLRNIIGNPFEELALRRHALYKGLPPEDINIRYDWYISMDAEKRLSNIYDILSLPMKLQLMGLDPHEAEERSQENAEKARRDYLNYYSEGDPDSVISAESTGSGLLYTKDDFRQNRLRMNLAVQEHYRWNAYMIMSGFIPASKQQIREGKVKDYKLRYHGNLTTFEGLFDFYDMTGNDVIRWDFQIMDELGITRSTV